MQQAVFAHLPPQESRAVALQCEPGGNVRLVVHVRDYDLISCTKGLPDGQTHQTNEGSGVHAERNFVRMTSVYEICHGLPGAPNGLVYLAAPCVSTSALHIAFDQMVVHSVENDPRDLRASGIVKENESGKPT